MTPPQTSAEPSLRFAVAGFSIEMVVHPSKGIGTSVFVTRKGDGLELITCSDGASCD